MSLLSRPEMDMGWVRPWVGLGRVGSKMLVCGGLDWVGCRLEYVAFAGMDADGYPSRLDEFGHISAVRPNSVLAGFHILCWIGYFQFLLCLSHYSSRMSMTIVQLLSAVHWRLPIIKQ